MSKRYTEAQKLLDALKEKESEIKLMAKLEHLGLIIPAGETDLAKILLANNRPDLLELFETVLTSK